MAKVKYKSGAAPGAPKPKIEPRKPPVRSTWWFKLSLALVAAGIIVLIVFIVLGRVHRSNVLEDYTGELDRAMRPFTQHNVSGAPDSFVDIPERFRTDEISPARLEESARRWSEDFAQAATNVRGLLPPPELEEANATLARALDDYAGVARSYLVLADQKRLERDARGSELEALQAQFDAWRGEIVAARLRADAAFAAGNRAIDELKVAWGLSPAPTLPDGIDLDGLNLDDIPIPDGGEHG